MKQSWKKNFSILLIATLSSKAIGFLRELVIASRFGVSQEFDILLTVFVVPNMIISLLLYAIPHIVIPRLDLGQKSEAKFYTLFAKQFFWPYIIFLLIIVIIYNLLFQLYIKLTPSIQFENHIQLASNLTILFAFFTFFSSTYNIFKAVYNAKERFTLPAFTPLLIHICVILSVLFFYQEYGVLSFAYGLVLGSVLQIFVFVFDLVKRNIFKYFRFSLQPNKLHVGSYVIILLIEFLGQSYALIDRSFIADLPEGHISSMYYAGILNNLPVTIIGLTLGTVFFPKISLYAQNRNFLVLKSFLKKGLVFSFLVGFPFSIVFYFYGEDIITLMFERGAFSNNASFVTSKYLQVLSIGLPFIFFHILLAKACFALHKERILFLSTFLAIVVKIVLSVLFMSKSYFWGLSLATSISFMLNVIIIVLLLYRRSELFLKVK
ncbi:lipid II flippase MurJ [Cognatitamlana onchidii]|uniref:lipid II flippase MurJ n=1 Tax=Cognatitamlana onchidii TaxID=2562860 RepID=UPI0010A6480C|nr:lipid II flippase MurJ [Algibacter onchidii]